MIGKAGHSVREVIFQGERLKVVKKGSHVVWVGYKFKSSGSLPSGYVVDDCVVYARFWTDADAEISETNSRYSVSSGAAAVVIEVEGRQTVLTSDTVLTIGPSPDDLTVFGSFQATVPLVLKRNQNVRSEEHTVLIAIGDIEGVAGCFMIFDDLPAGYQWGIDYESLFEGDDTVEISSRTAQFDVFK